MTTDLQVCIVTYFQEWRSPAWSGDVKDLALDVAKSLGATFSHFSCNYKGEVRPIRKNKTYRYLGRNLANLEILVRDQEMLNLCYVNSPNADVIHNTEFAVLGDNDTGYNPYRRVYIEFPISRIESYGSEEKTKFLCSWIERVDEIADVQYGFVATMERSKLPGIYFSDIAVSTVDAFEELNLNMWLVKRIAYSTVIRSIYLANLLGHGHVSRMAHDTGKLVMGLKNLLGEDHVKVLPSGKTYFDLLGKPKDLSPLRSLLEEHKLYSNPEEVKR